MLCDTGPTVKPQQKGQHCTRPFECHNSVRGDMYRRLRRKGNERAMAMKTPTSVALGGLSAVGKTTVARLLLARQQLGVRR
jgi:2-phosphoglycerate kinase